MAVDVLYVPEEHLREVIKVIRAGLKHTKVSKDASRNLLKWCKEEEEYLNRCETDDD